MTRTPVTMFLVMSLLFAISVELVALVNASATEWDVVLTASIDVYSDVSEFGVRVGATEGFDAAYDQVDPPSPPVGVVSYFWYPSNPATPVDLRRLSVSMIPPSSPMTWTYNVRPVSIGGTIVIAWSASDIATIPTEFSVYLSDSSGSILADMRVVTEYSFTADADTTYDFTVQVELVGDVNGDGKVDASDLLDLSEAYGSDSSKPNWNSDCDINNDGKVDVLDLYALSKNYGETVQTITLWLPMVLSMLGVLVGKRKLPRKPKD